jgi:hypothetical protein
MNSDKFKAWQDRLKSKTIPKESTIKPNARNADVAESESEFIAAKAETGKPDAAKADEIAKAYEQGYLDALRQLELPMKRPPPYQPVSEEQLQRDPSCQGSKSVKPTATNALTVPVPVAAVPVPAVAHATGQATGQATGHVTGQATGQIAGQATQAAVGVAAPVVQAVLPVPIAAAGAPKLSSKHLWDAMFYWMDLLADSCDRTLSQVWRAVVDDMNEKFTIAAQKGLYPLRLPFPQRPNTIEEFKVALVAVPNEDLRPYLATYNVVPAYQLETLPQAQLGQAQVQQVEPGKTLLDQLQRMQGLSSIVEFEKDDENTKPVLPATLEPSG